MIGAIVSEKNLKQTSCLTIDNVSLLLLSGLVDQLKVLGALENSLLNLGALRALELQYDLLGRLGLDAIDLSARNKEIQTILTNLLVEDRLGLTTESGLLAVVTTLALGKKTRFARLVLRDGVRLMSLAFLAKRVLLLRETDL